MAQGKSLKLAMRKTEVLIFEAWNKLRKVWFRIEVTTVFDMGSLKYLGLRFG